MPSLSAASVDEYVLSVSGGSDYESSTTDSTQSTTTAFAQSPSLAPLEMPMLPWANGSAFGEGAGGGDLRAQVAVTLATTDFMNFKAGVGFGNRSEPAASAGAGTGSHSKTTFPAGKWGEGGVEIHAQAMASTGPSLSQPDGLTVATRHRETLSTPTKTPLMLAVVVGDAEAVLERLMQPTARVNAKDLNGQTALHLCVLGFEPAQHEHVWMPMIVALITAGANPDAADRDMATSLMYACRLGFSPLIERLLAGGIRLYGTPS
jgi:hypothetical protein